MLGLDRVVEVSLLSNEPEGVGAAANFINHTGAAVGGGEGFGIEAGVAGEDEAALIREWAGGFGVGKVMAEESEDGVGGILILRGGGSFLLAAEGGNEEQ